jgi:phosphohistidine phosphatase
MDLILWRHAEAEDGFPDLKRALTPKGRKQAAKMASWLHKHLREPARVLVSPALRAQQTAEAFTKSFETVDEIAPGAAYAAVLEAARWPDMNGAVLVIGHQPTLGQAAASLLSGQPMAWEMRKGGIFWLVHQPGVPGEVVLRAALSPGLV